jgi:hypothetical protein
MSTNTKVKPIKCSVCGRFMSKIGLIARIRLEVEAKLVRTHICKKETITYATGEIVHT